MKRVPEHDERYNALEQTRRQLKQEFSDEFARLQQRESIEYRNNVLRMLDYNQADLAIEYINNPVPAKEARFSCRNDRMVPKSTARATYEQHCEEAYNQYRMSRDIKDYILCDIRSFDHGKITANQRYVDVENLEVRTTANG